MRFAEIIGQDELKTMLRRGVDEGRVSHAQMFSGESGAGTLPLAVAYAQYLNCTHRTNGDSCGECASCVQIAQLAHPDLHFVFPSNSSSKSGAQKPTSDAFLGEWRELFARTGGYFDEKMWYDALGLENQQGLIATREADEVIRKLSFKSFESEYKVMIVWQPERMHTDAANKLLKILEEPWSKTVFLFVSAQPRQLLATIISRLQEIAVPAIERRVLADYAAAHYRLSGEDSELAARLAGGNFIELRRIAEGEDKGGREEYFDYFKELMRSSYTDNHLQLIDWAERMATLGRENQKRFFEYSIMMLRENYMLTAGMDNISYLWGEELRFSHNFSPFVDSRNVEALVAENESALFHISRNGNPRIIFTHYALSVSKLIGPMYRK